MNVKGKGQRLIPEELLKYLEAFKEAHPDPTEGGGATLDDIVDSQGNKRFVEGNGTPATISGIESLFCKWSLSGTHLMIVYAGTLSGGTSLTARTLASFEFPEWIFNKIFPLNSDGLVSVINAVFAYEGNFTYKQQKLIKTANGLEIANIASGTISSSSSGFRIQFDLLIDSE